MAIPLPANEAQRAESLRRYEILDTPLVQALDDITRLAAQVFAGHPLPSSRSLMQIVNGSNPVSVFRFPKHRASFLSAPMQSCKQST